jgi:single-stranded DNA-binding protein
VNEANQKNETKEETAAAAEQAPADSFADDSKPIDIANDKLPF